MNEDAVKNWILKAESDLKIGRDELTTEKPATDAVCFHMQQCTEKYIKSFLIFHGKEIHKTHNIAEIIRECTEIELEFQQLFNWDVDKLTDYAVDIRYGEDFYFPPIEETKEAVKIAEKVKEFVSNKLKGMGFEL